LVAGIQLSRSMTGAVHELYEGTRHVKEGDFSYRIPVKGHDQLAETRRFRSTPMTENLGRLIVVAKEKERLESELEKSVRRSRPHSLWSLLLIPRRTLKTLS